jgi:dCMP deaminase
MSFHYHCKECGTDLYNAEYQRHGYCQRCLEDLPRERLAMGLPGKSRHNGSYTKARPTWDAYYLQIARDVAARVTCPAGQVGAVIVSPEGVPLMFGYNGAPSGVAHCDEAGCSWVERVSTESQQLRLYPRHVHAEANAIARAARVGARLDGATLYVTQEPCPECLKLCLQAGIRAIVAGAVRDPDWFANAGAICHHAGVTLRHAAEGEE